MTPLLKSRWTRLQHLPTEVETSDLCRFFQYLLRFSWVMVSDTCATATCTCFSVKSQHQERFSSSNLEQLLGKVFRADSENPEHPERLSRSKFVFSARLLEKEDKVVTILTRSSDSINKNEAKGVSYKHTVLWVRSEFKFTSYHLDDTK